MRLRRSLLTLHLVLGVAAAPFLLVLGLSGAVLVFEDEITDAANASLTHVTPGPLKLPLDMLVRRAASEYPNTAFRSARLPMRDDRAYEIDFAGPRGAARGAFVDPYSGRVLGPASALRQPVRWIHVAHVRLFGGPVGEAIVGIAAAVLFVLALTGIVLWWPLKRFRPRRGAEGRRALFDLHASIGVWAWLFLLVFSATGIVMHWNAAALKAASRLTGTKPPAPAPVKAPVTCALDAGWDLGPLLEEARTVARGARITMVSLPSPDAPLRVTMRYPEDRTPAGRTNVLLDHCTGNLLSFTSSRTAPAGYRITNVWMRPLHTGDVLGWPTRILAALASLALPLLTLTGPLLWWTRRNATRTAAR